MPHTPINRATLRRSYWLLAIALVALLAFVSAFVILGQHIVASSRDQKALDATLYQLHEIWSDLQDAETGQRGYLLSSNPRYLAPYHHAVADIDARFDTIHNVMENDPACRDLFHTAVSAKQTKFAELAETVRLTALGSNDAATALLRTDTGLHAMETLRTAVGGLQRQIRAERNATNVRTEQLVRVESWVVAGLCITLLATVSLAIWLLLRMIRRINTLALRLEQEATHDGLTGLPNRRLFFEWLELSLAQAARARTRVGMLFIDLDGFKRVNDNLGHDAGDDLLRTVARRFADTVRAGDLVARFGGDEFVIVVAQEDVSHASLGRLAQRLIDTFADPLPGTRHDTPVGATIGIAMFPDAAASADGLVKASDAAMYQAKVAGKGQYRFAAVTSVPDEV